MSYNNAGNPPAQPAQNENTASHHAAKSVFFTHMANRLEGEDAAYCVGLSDANAVRAGFLAPHMAGWPI